VLSVDAGLLVSSIPGKEATLELDNFHSRENKIKEIILTEREKILVFFYHIQEARIRRQN